MRKVFAAGEVGGVFVFLLFVVWGPLLLRGKRHFSAKNLRHYTSHAAFFARSFAIDFFFAPPVCSKLFCKTETRSITLVGLGAFFGFPAISFPPASTFSSITSMSASRKSS